MIKLNNRGWGLQVMMIFVLILMIALVVIAVLVNQTFSDIAGPTKDPIVNPGNDDVSYKDLENELLDAVKEYQEIHYNDTSMLDGEMITVSLDKLQKENLIDEIKDIKTSRPCTGYGTFELKSDKIVHNAYLKCNNYETSGYND